MFYHIRSFKKVPAQELKKGDFLMSVRHHDMHYEIAEITSVTPMNKSQTIVVKAGECTLYHAGDVVSILATPAAKPKVKKVLRGFDEDILEEIYED